MADKIWLEMLSQHRSVTLFTKLWQLFWESIYFRCRNTIPQLKGGVNQHLESWNSHPKIWNLGTEKISGIYFKYPNLNLFYKWTHRDRTVHDPCHNIAGAWWYNHNLIMHQNMHAHFRAAIIYYHHEPSSKIQIHFISIKWNPMELWDYVTHWIIHFWYSSLTHLDLIIWFGRCI